MTDENPTPPPPTGDDAQDPYFTELARPAYPPPSAPPGEFARTGASGYRTGPSAPSDSAAATWANPYATQALA
ncbi:MAG: hypothetical protein WB471_12585, partial [Nocardioides sp.]